MSTLSDRTLSGPSNALAEDGADQLRYEQIAVLVDRAGMLGFSSVLSCLLLLRTFWSMGLHRYLIGLSAVLTGAHVLAIAGSRRWLSTAPRAVSRRAAGARISMTAIIACAWATVPCMLMPVATHEQQQMLIFIFAGLVSSSILIAPVLPAALLFCGITTFGVLMSMRLDFSSVNIEHAGLIVLYFILTCGVVLHQSRDFARRVLSEMMMTEQGDILSLRLRDFGENATDWLWETDAEQRLQHVSERLAAIMGCDRSAIEGLFVADLVVDGSQIPEGEKHDSVALLSCLADGLPFRDLQVAVLFKNRSFYFSVSGKPVIDKSGKFQGHRGVGSDITTARKSAERIAYLARHDSLTGLPNRTNFHEMLNRACAGPRPFALLSLDLDGFKSVNDTLGHGMGDKLLIAVADRMRSCVGEGDAVARVGGVEFAVLQSGGNQLTTEALARRLVARIGEPYQIDDVHTSIGLSIGIALSSGPHCDSGILLRGADLALCQSKSRGRGNWHFFEAGMAERAQARHAMQTDLGRAIDGNELILEFQPILDIATGAITGAEALVRWLHPTRGRISPADFIPIAEESGMIVALGAWVLRRACLEAATWTGEVRVAVNLSPLQFRDPNLLALVDRVLDETGLPAHRLELEITESVFLDAADRTVACLEALRSRGIHIALDDFGTGYSSLSYLRSFPFDKVKIDQSFIRDLSVNDDAIAIVQAIVGMASSLGMYTTGEGVETVSQARLLQLTGCSQVQGYLFGRPCSAEDIALIMSGEPPKLDVLLGPAAAMRPDRIPDRIAAVRARREADAQAGRHAEQAVPLASA